MIYGTFRRAKSSTRRHSYSSGSIIHWKLVYGSMSRREDKKFAIIHQLTSGKIVSRERLRIS
jgi:hypothetical protein